MQPVPPSGLYISDGLATETELSHFQAATSLLLQLLHPPRKSLHLCSVGTSTSAARMEAGSSVRFVHDASAGSVHPASIAQLLPAAGMIHPSMGALLAGFGMAPTGTFLPGSSTAPAAANLPPNVWNRVPVMARQPGTGGAGNNGERAAQQQPHRGPWTAEEDDILKRMVMEHGERKWAVVSQFLPGRIGKQCRERWTNHLRPDIKKSVWTVEDDLKLIEAHKVYGNRWSMIAKQLRGRSENMVKNHWNATRRSLKAKRRLKKKNENEVIPFPSSALEDYIRGLYHDAADLASPPSPSPQPVSTAAMGMTMYPNSGAGSSTDAPPSSVSLMNQAPVMGFMYHNFGGGGGSSSSVSPLLTNMDNQDLLPTLLDLNAYNNEVPGLLQAMNPQTVTDHELLLQQQMEASAYPKRMMGYPFVACNFPWQQPSSAVHTAGDDNSANDYNEDHPHYYGGSNLSGSGGSGSADDVDVVQMASREFLMPSQEEATLDLARFM